MILKKSRKLLINYFSRTDDGLIYLKNKIRLKRHIFDKLFFDIKNLFLKKNSRSLAYDSIYLILDFITIIISIILLPFAIIIYFFGYKISTTNNKTIGYHFEEIFYLFMYCKVNKIDTKKVIIFSPSATAHNKYIDKFYFANNFTVINNLISAAIIVPLSHWNFLKLDIFLNSNKEYYLLPNQIIKNFQIFIDKKIFIKQQLMQNFYVKFFQKKNHRFFSESNVLKYIKKNEFSNLKIYKKSKIALIKIRETKNSIYRNSQIDNLKISINYLLKKKFLVFRVIDKSSKNLYLKNKNYIELNIENDYEKKINALLMSRYDIFIGNISGLHTWATSLFFSRKNIFIDCINFNEINFINKKNHFLYKTIKTKNKSKISKENIQYSNLDIYKYYTNKKMKSLYYLDNTKYEIINTLKKFIKT